ncbi:MAG TPA: hypothetical protein VF370_01395 [Candidatus Cryosericum sp.]
MSRSHFSVLLAGLSVVSYRKASESRITGSDVARGLARMPVLARHRSPGGCMLDPVD